MCICSHGQYSSTTSTSAPNSRVRTSFASRVYSCIRHRTDHFTAPLLNATKMSVQIQDFRRLHCLFAYSSTILKLCLKICQSRPVRSSTKTHRKPVILLKHEKALAPLCPALQHMVAEPRFPRFPRMQIIYQLPRSSASLRSKKILYS